MIVLCCLFSGFLFLLKVFFGGFILYFIFTVAWYLMFFILFFCYGRYYVPRHYYSKVWLSNLFYKKIMKVSFFYFIYIAAWYLMFFILFFATTSQSIITCLRESHKLTHSIYLLHIISWSQNNNLSRKYSKTCLKHNQIIQ